MANYNEDYNQSINDPDAFWQKQADNIEWFKKPEKILTKNEQGFYRWFEGGKLNTSYLALDYHVENGRGDQLALIYDSPVADRKSTFTYKQLRDEVAQFAGVLTNLGIKKGDTVIIYMPMIPRAVVAMLACARVGAIHSVVFGGFAPHELAVRIDDAKPKAILTASGGIEVTRLIEYKPLIDAAIAEAQHKPKDVVVYQRDFFKAVLNQPYDHDWHDLLDKAQPQECIEVDAHDPLYILYTSGTTGKPKGVVRDNGGHAVAMKYSMQYVYNAQPGEVYWAASDVGWVVGHSYIVYGPLINGNTTVVFEGKPVRTPDPGTFWRMIEEYKISTLFTAPTAIRAIKKEDPEGKFHAQYDTSSLKMLFLAGERTDVATYHWAKDLLRVPVIDHWWQTESGWAMLANMAGYDLIEYKPGSATKPVPGYNIQILDEDSKPLRANEEGIVAIKLPLAPGTLATLWQDDERYRESYLSQHEGYYVSGDGGYVDEDGYVFITGRIDDVINVAGHRLSTADMEEVIASHEAVAECAVIGAADDLKGQIPLGLVVKKAGTSVSDDVLEKALVQMVRDKVGAVASFKKALVVTRLPKTRSGKILRKYIRFIADGKPFAPPSTIEDLTVLDEIREAISTMYYKTLAIEYIDGICKIAVNHADNKNFLDMGVLGELEQAIDAMLKNNDVKAGIITGAVQNLFIPGADLKQLSRYTHDQIKSFVTSGRNLLQKIAQSAKPIVAAVNGPALGSGFELAMACHLVVAEDKAVFGFPEVAIGLTPMFGGAGMLSGYLNKNKALELLLTGEQINSEKAMNLNLVNHVVEDGESMQKAKEILEIILANSSNAVSTLIHRVNVYCNQNRDIMPEIDEFVEGFEKVDFKQGLDAYLQKLPL